MPDPKVAHYAAGIRRCFERAKARLTPEQFDEFAYEAWDAMEEFDACDLVESYTLPTTELSKAVNEINNLRMSDVLADVLRFQAIKELIRDRKPEAVTIMTSGGETAVVRADDAPLF